MFKKAFTFASLTALSAVVVASLAAGCSSSTTTTSTPTDDGSAPAADGGSSTGKDGGKPGKTGDAGGDEDANTGDPGTVGKLCASDDDCDGNLCTKGAFTGGDLFGDPICIGTSCEPAAEGSNKIPFCDQDQGLCIGTSPNTICLPACTYDATTITAACQGGNKCAADLIGTTTDNKLTVIGVCNPACATDADCKGSDDQKCQVESGTCVKAAAYVAYTKKLGDTCTVPASDKDPEECNCNAPEGSNTGLCGFACVTGAAGDAACATAAAGYKCTAGLPAVDDDGGVLFAGQPDGVSGACLKTCATDDDCSTLVVGGKAKVCEALAGGKFCVSPAK